MPFSPDSPRHAPPGPFPSDDSTRDAASELPPPTDTARSDRPSRVVQPELLKHPSLLSGLRRTWRPSSEPSPSGGQPDRARHSERARNGSHASEQASGADGDDSERDLNRDFVPRDPFPRLDAERAEASAPIGDGVLCARWDTLAQGAGEPRRVLLIAHKSGAFAVWDCSDLDAWHELLSLRSLEAVLDPALSKRYPRGIGAIVDAVILPAGSCADPTIAVVTRRATSSSSHVLLYSLRTHRVAFSFDLTGIAHRVAVNRRFIVVSTTAPLALQLYSIPSFQPAPFSPIEDLVPSPFDGAPVFSLGQGGRLLAYATDRSLPSSRLDRSPAKPGAGLVAHPGFFGPDPVHSMGTSDLFGAGGSGGTLMSASGHVGGEVARKVSEGVLSGVKAIGEAGMSYWMTRSTSGRSSQEAGFTDSKLSKSAPAQGVVNFGKRLSFPSSPFSASKPLSLSSSPRDAEPSIVTGTVIVVDLLTRSITPNEGRSSRMQPHRSSTTLRTVAHFRPYQGHVALVSLSPSSASILTASAPSHSFDIFELQPASTIGVSATGVAASSDGSSGKVWHRYRLQRGFSAARATSASWTQDGRVVAVGTAKGTAHVYAIQPRGGKANFEDHFNAQVKNLADLPPLSITLSSVARIRSDIPITESGYSSLGPSPSFAFVPKSDTFASTFRPTGSDSLPAPQHASHNSNATREPSILDMLAFYPHLATAQMHRLQVIASSPTSAVAAAGRGDVGKLATTAVSGLTQLMKSRGGFNGSTQAGRAADDAKKDLVVSSSAQAEWRLARTADEEDVTEQLSEYDDAEAAKFRPARTRWSAYAEIETFSRSPRVLPRSIYQSHQFNFASLPVDHAASLAQGVYRAINTRPLEMRCEVLVRQGVSTTTQELGSAASLEVRSEPASFDQPIKTAMQTVLDNGAILSGSPQLPAPSFPVGVAAKQGSWMDSIPIRAVGPATFEGIERVRQGLGRVRLPNAGEIVDAARRRRSSAAAATNEFSSQAAYSSSISFEDDEAVFTDRLSIEDLASTSTSCTSQGDDGPAYKAQDGDEVDEWGWDEPLDGVVPALDPSPTLNFPPFDDDFENFELEQPVPVDTPLADRRGALGSSDSAPSNAAPSFSSKVELEPILTELAPVASSSPPLSSSTKPINPLLQVEQVHTPSLSSSPSSVSSRTSAAGEGKKKKKKK
ncbi:uncharacterized protein JCM15063_003944 [Sporobolomyces koalae]|uniref:uncharacterized protein n=1 Tax=Sporobolomyces koalae TaxID=500713 RepID=UPI0031793103